MSRSAGGGGFPSAVPPPSRPSSKRRPLIAAAVLGDATLGMFVRLMVLPVAEAEDLERAGAALLRPHAAGAATHPLRRATSVRRLARSTDWVEDFELQLGEFWHTVPQLRLFVAVLATSPGAAADGSDL